MTSVKLELKLTRHHISRIHRIVILNESKAIHELHLGNVASAMGLEVFLDIFLGGWI